MKNLLTLFLLIFIFGCSKNDNFFEKEEKEVKEFKKVSKSFVDDFFNKYFIKKGDSWYCCKKMNNGSVRIYQIKNPSLHFQSFTSQLKSTDRLNGIEYRGCIDINSDGARSFDLPNLDQFNDSEILNTKRWSEWSLFSFVDLYIAKINGEWKNLEPHQHSDFIDVKNFDHIIANLTP